MGEVISQPPHKFVSDSAPCEPAPFARAITDVLTGRRGPYPPNCVYVISDANTTLYIGKTTAGAPHRLHEHCGGDGRDISEIGSLIIAHFPESFHWSVRIHPIPAGIAAADELSRLEIRMIRDLRPCLNHWGNTAPTQLPGHYNRYPQPLPPATAPEIDDGMLRYYLEWTWIDVVLILLTFGFWIFIKYVILIPSREKNRTYHMRCSRCGAYATRKGDEHWPPCPMCGLDVRNAFWRMATYGREER